MPKDSIEVDEATAIRLAISRLERRLENLERIRVEQTLYDACDPERIVKAMRVALGLGTQHIGPR